MKEILYYPFKALNLQHQYGTIVGYSEEFKEKATIINFGYGDRIAIPISELHDFSPTKPIKLHNTLL
jgi:hypothetical protein